MLHKNITQRSFHQSHHFARHFLQNTVFCHLGSRYIDENTEVRKNKCHHCEQHIAPVTSKPAVWEKKPVRSSMKNTYTYNCMLLQLQTLIEDIKSSFQEHKILPMFSFKIKRKFVGLSWQCHYCTSSSVIFTIILTNQFLTSLRSYVSSI